MKRGFYIAIALLTTVLINNSCGDKEDDVVVVDLPGTTWRYYYSNEENTSEEIIHFTTTSSYSLYYKYTGANLDSGSFSNIYTYSPPNIILEKKAGRMTGVVEKDYMTLEDSNGGVGDYHKQD